MKLSEIPQEVIDEYNLEAKVTPYGFVYIEIQCAMYGLKQSGKLANKELKTVLGKAGYHPSQFTPGLYTHSS